MTPSASGVDIRSTFLPPGGECMCLCAADSADVVKRADDAAQILVDRVVPALDLTRN